MKKRTDDDDDLVEYDPPEPEPERERVKLPPLKPVDQLERTRLRPAPTHVTHKIPK